MNDPAPFRMGKINSIWRKAQKILSAPRLADLFADLVHQDKMEKELKHTKTEGLDVAGLKEAQVRQSLIDILNSYHLSDHFPDYKDGRGKFEAQKFSDLRLRKVWKEALQAGFSEAEMETLQEELGHHQQKVDMYNSLKVAYDELEGQMDNSLDNLDEKDTVWKNLTEIKQMMKEKNLEVTSKLANLQDKVKQRQDNNEFQDPRVYQLWVLAKKSNMSEDELRSFKKELTHFEHRIKKVKYMKDQVNKLDGRQNLKSKTDSSEMENRAQQYEAKINKYHEELKYQIKKRLDEL